MWRYRGLHFQSRLLQRYHLCRLTREKHGLSHLLPDQHSAEQSPVEAPTHWFLSHSHLDGGPFHNVQPLRESKCADDFGLLSTRTLSQETAQKLSSHPPFVDQLLSRERFSLNNTDAIPTTADASELGGSSEGNEVEHLEELLDQGYDVSAVLQDVSGTESSRRSATSRAILEEEFQTDVGMRNVSGSKPHVEPLNSSVPELSPSVSTACRFDPDINRRLKASAEELVAAVSSQDMGHLRSILMDKKWPRHLDIGPYLDEIFDLVIRESIDTDEALMFIRDFAVCNRRGFLHDVNGIRLATRVARDSGSISEAIDMLTVFRNMFLVKSPLASKSRTPLQLIEEFYTTLFSIGTETEVEEAHKTMIALGFDKDSTNFIRTFIDFMVKRHDISFVVDEYQQLSTRYGVSCACGRLWEGIFNSLVDPNVQARLAGRLFAHCRQYSNPSAVISSLVVALIRLGHVEDAKAVFAKVAVPGKFFKEPLSCMARSESSLEVVENFAALMSQCMFSEKRRQKETKAGVIGTSVLTPEFLSVLDAFCGVGRPNTPSRNDAKRKLHRVNDEQLYELAKFVQHLWLDKAEKANNIHSIERFVSWCASNKLEIPAKLIHRIKDLQTTVESTDRDRR